MRFEGQIDAEKLTKALERIVRKLPEAEKRYISKLGESAVVLLRAEAPKKSGRLQRSQRVRRQKGSIIAGSRARHARIIDEGGVVEPKGTALAIPFSGSPRRRPRGKGLSVIRRDGNNLLGDKRRGPRYTLVPSVTIKATHYVEKAERRLRPSVPDQVVRTLNMFLDEVTR